MELEARKGQLDEEVGLVKASAWAWYHHHPLGMVPAAAEEQKHHLPSRKLAPKPSRYKLEAAIMAPPSPSEEESYQQAAAEISLLDSYEIQRISRQLDVYIKSSHDQYYQTRSFFVSATNSPLQSQTITTTTTDHKKFNKLLKKKKQQHSNALIWSSVRVRVRVPVLCCSTKHDVVAIEPSSPPPPRSKMESPSRQRRPGNHHVMVVKAATCRPRG